MRLTEYFFKFFKRKRLRQKNVKGIMILDLVCRGYDYEASRPLQSRFDRADRLG